MLYFLKLYGDDVHELNMGEPTYISAKHNQGMSDLYETLKNLFKNLISDDKNKGLDPTTFHNENDPLINKSLNNFVQVF